MKKKHILITTVVFLLGVIIFMSIFLFFMYRVSQHDGEMIDDPDPYKIHIPDTTIKNDTVPKKHWTEDIH